MFSNSIGYLHQITTLLLEPVIWALMFFVGLTLYEIGIALSERFFQLPRMQFAQDVRGIKREGKKRIETADFITRIAPMLGLMGTLIPLGPGLSALGEGDFKTLTTSISVAFDTTILGLLVGIVGFVLARMRRRWYDEAIHSIQTGEQHG